MDVSATVASREDRSRLVALAIAFCAALEERGYKSRVSVRALSQDGCMDDAHEEESQESE